MLFDDLTPLFYYALVTPDKRVVLEPDGQPDSWTLPKLIGHGHHPHDIHVQERLGDHVEALSLADKELVVLNNEFWFQGKQHLCQLIVFSAHIKLRPTHRLLLADYNSAVQAIKDESVRNLVVTELLRRRF